MGNQRLSPLLLVLVIQPTLPLQLTLRCSFTPRLGHWHFAHHSSIGQSFQQRLKLLVLQELLHYFYFLLQEHWNHFTAIDRFVTHLRPSTNLSFLQEAADFHYCSIQLHLRYYLPRLVGKQKFLLRLVILKSKPILEELLVHHFLFLLPPFEKIMLDQADQQQFMRHSFTLHLMEVT